MRRRRTVPLPLEEAIKRPLKSLRLAASTSFTAPEVDVLATLFERMRRGGDMAVVMRAHALEVNQIARKIVTMKHTIERQRERRKVKAS